MVRGLGPRTCTTTCGARFLLCKDGVTPLTYTYYYTLIGLARGRRGTTVEKPIISFRIRADIKQALQKLAAADRRSLSSYIELALEDHIAAKKKSGRKR